MRKLKAGKWLAAMLVTLPLIGSPVIGSAEEIMSSGSFTGASGHATKGDVRVVKTAEGLEIVLDRNFDFDGAPDPKVGFGNNGKYDTRSQLAHLKKNTGEQRYTVPESLDITEYNEIYIWCEAYSVPLGIAEIH